MGLVKTENNIYYIPFEIIFGTYYYGPDHLLSEYYLSIIVNIMEEM